MIGDRLAEVRKEAGLSLREFAARLEEESGHSVAHTTLRDYEGRDSVPSDFLLAVVEAFDVDPRWLLSGDEAVELDQRRRVALRETLDEIRSRLDGIEASEEETISDASEFRSAWERFQEGLEPGHVLRSTIVESWIRSRDASVDPVEAAASLRKVSEEELEERRRAHADLLQAARPHMGWLSRVVGPVPHVVYLTGPEGVVLHAVGQDPEELEDQGLAPGYDWSEQTMGTNGAGTALATNRPVVVVGPEHYASGLHDFVCTAVPIRGPDGKPVGCLDLSTALRHGYPGRLGLVAYAAQATEHELVGNARSGEQDGPIGGTAPRREG